LFKQPCSFPLFLGLLCVNYFLPLSFSYFSLSLEVCRLGRAVPFSLSRVVSPFGSLKKVLLSCPPPPPPPLRRFYFRARHHHHHSGLSFFLPHSSTPNFLLLVLSIVLPKPLLLILLSINQSHSHSASRYRRLDLKGMCSTDTKTRWFRCMNECFILGNAGSRILQVLFGDGVSLRQLFGPFPLSLFTSRNILFLPQSVTLFRHKVRHGYCLLFYFLALIIFYLINLILWQQRSGLPFQLLSMACLSLAVKMEESRVPFLLDLQQFEPKFVFAPETIQRMELWVMFNLKWRLRSVTSYDYLHYFITKISFSSSESSDQFFSAASNLILSTPVVTF